MLGAGKILLRSLGHGWEAGCCCAARCASPYLPFSSSLKQLAPRKCLRSTQPTGALVSSRASWHHSGVQITRDEEEVVCEDTLLPFATYKS